MKRIYRVLAATAFLAVASLSAVQAQVMPASSASGANPIAAVIVPDTQQIINTVNGAITAGTIQAGGSAQSWTKFFVGQRINFSTGYVTVNSDGSLSGSARRSFHIFYNPITYWPAPFLSSPIVLTSCSPQKFQDTYSFTLYPSATADAQGRPTSYFVATGTCTATGGGQGR
jgi:hypothetical protein